MTTTKKIRINFVRRAIPTRGPFMSDEYNAAQEEASVDLNMIAERWNAEAYTLFNSLPRGDDETRWVGATSMPDPLASGLDGTTIFVDTDAAVDIEAGLFWSTDYDRPLTLKEFGSYLDDRITDVYDELSATITASISGLTDDQWEMIGDRIKDGSASVATSLDIVANSARDDLDDLILDVFNSAGSLGTLASSGYTVEEMVGALLNIHGSIAWGADPSSASHSAITTTEEADIRGFIGKSGPGPETPTYTSTNYITIGHTLEAVAGTLDNRLYLTTTASTAHIGTVTGNPHHVSLEQARTQSSLFTGGVTFTTGNINMNSVGRIINLADPVDNQDATTKSWVTTQLATKGTATRYEQSFTGHTDVGTPIVVTHSLGVVFPLVQVVDTTGAGVEYSGLQIDENYVYEREQGISASGAFVNIEYTDGNSFSVYTDVTDGVIIYVC